MTGQPKVTRVTVRAELDDGSVIEIAGSTPETVTIDRERPLAEVEFDEDGIPELPMQRDVYRLTVTAGDRLLAVRRIGQEG